MDLTDFTEREKRLVSPMIWNPNYFAEKIPVSERGRIQKLERELFCCEKQITEIAQADRANYPSLYLNAFKRYCLDDSHEGHACFRVIFSLLVYDIICCKEEGAGVLNPLLQLEHEFNPKKNKVIKRHHGSRLQKN